MSAQPTDDMAAVARKISKKDTAKAVLKEFSGDDVTGMAAEIAYHLVFALPPLIIFTITMAAVVDAFSGVNVSGELKSMISERAPSDAAEEILTGMVDSAISGVSGGIASFGAVLSAVLALWTASNGVGALMKSFNRAYDVEEARTFVKKKLVSIGLTVLLVLCIIGAFVLFVFGGGIGEWVADQAGLGSVFTWAWQIARWPVAVLLIMVLLSLLYYFGPNVEQTYRFVSAGSVIATILWIVAVLGFGIYVQFANPGSAYGVAGGLIVLLFFLYVTGIVFLIGAEVNAVIARQYDPQTVAAIGSERAPGETPADTARCTRQLMPGRRRNRDPVVRPTDTPPQPKGPKTRVFALGAVSAGVVFMLWSKVKGALSH